MATSNQNQQISPVHHDDLLAAIRKNLPIVVVFCTLVAGAVRTEMMSNDQEKRIANLEQLLDQKAFTEHAIWKTNITRDVKELQKMLSQDNIKDWNTWRESVEWRVKNLLKQLSLYTPTPGK